MSKQNLIDQFFQSYTQIEDNSKRLNFFNFLRTKKVALEIELEVLKQTIEKIKDYNVERKIVLDTVHSHNLEEVNLLNLIEIKNLSQKPTKEGDSSVTTPDPETKESLLEDSYFINSKSNSKEESLLLPINQEEEKPFAMQPKNDLPSLESFLSDPSPAPIIEPTIIEEKKDNIIQEKELIQMDSTSNKKNDEVKVINLLPFDDLFDNKKKSQSDLQKEQPLLLLDIGIEKTTNNNKPSIPIIKEKRSESVPTLDDFLKPMTVEDMLLSKPLKTKTPSLGDFDEIIGVKSTKDEKKVGIFDFF